jgi:LPS export ABC transporter protein LptC
MIKHRNKNGLLLVLLLLAAAGVTTWLRTRPDITGPGTAAETIRQIDFFMENFRVRQYDAQGRLRYTFNGRELNHFPEDGRAEISSPHLELESEQGHWTVRANRAIANGGTDGKGGEEIRFLGNVRMEQADRVLIRGEVLLLQPESEYMESLEPVVITGAGGRIEAASLKADLQTGIHTLTGVKGRYAP